MQKPLLTQRIYCAVLFLFCTAPAFAQSVTEVKAIRLYEHHSSEMTGMPLGSGANGSKSGYDFVQRRYFNSFDEATMDAYTQGEEANIDMVEHNGPFGAASSYLGFTAGMSTIWSGQIKGNGTTRWMKAPATFDYDAVDDINDITSVYKPVQASESAEDVRNNHIYIGKIRGGDLYVVIKCYNVQPAPSNQGTNASIFFDFDYKYGSLATGIKETISNTVAVYPNPANDHIEVNLQNNGQVRSARILSPAGAVVLQPGILTNGRMDVSSLSTGIYFLEIETMNGDRIVKQVLKQ